MSFQNGKVNTPPFYKSIFSSSFNNNLILVGLNGTVACPKKFARGGGGTCKGNPRKGVKTQQKTKLTTVLATTQKNDKADTYR